jgi:hypothetical protein
MGPDGNHVKRWGQVVHGLTHRDTTLENGLGEGLRGRDQEDRIE